MLEPVSLVRDLAQTPAARGPRRFSHIALGDALADRPNAPYHFFGSEPPQRSHFRDGLAVPGNNDRFAGFNSIDHLGEAGFRFGNPDSPIHVTSLSNLTFPSNGSDP
jgi:hypothetical protein